jgi:hypothetical protein
MVSIQSSIVDRLPEVIPTDIIEVSNERHLFQYVDEDNTAAKTVYTLDSGPFRSIRNIEATVNGERVTIPSAAYETRQVQSTRGDDSVAFIDSEYYPDPGTEFSATYRVVPVIKRYVSSVDTEIKTTTTKMDDVVSSHQVDHATGVDLDSLGAFFGELGTRSGRSDNDYAVLLRSIVQSFGARGTKPGVKFAIASAVGADPDNITITEDFEKVGYEIEIEETNLDFVTTAITDIAELADPAGVELLSEPVIALGDRTVGAGAIESTVVTTESGIGDDAEYAIGGSWTLE